MAPRIDRLIAFASRPNAFISVYCHTLIVKRIVFFLSFPSEVNIVSEMKNNNEQKKKKKWRKRMIERRSFSMLLVAQSFPQWTITLLICICIIFFQILFDNPCIYILSDLDGAYMWRYIYYIFDTVFCMFSSVARCRGNEKFVQKFRRERLNLRCLVLCAV